MYRAYQCDRPATVFTSSRILQAHLRGTRRLRNLRVQASKQDLKVRVSDFVKSSAYSTYLQGLVFTGVLAAVDAAYSGDWSRIGAISKADEAWLQEVLPMLAAFHAFAAVVSGIVATRAGRPAVWPVAKASLVGGLAMFEQLLQVDD